MDFADLFSTAVRQLRHNPWLWVLGLLYVLPSFAVGQLLTPAESIQPEAWLAQLQEPAFDFGAQLEAVIVPVLEAVSDFERVTRFVVGLTAVLLITWFVTTLAEAGLILIVGRAATNQPPLPLRDLSREMRHLLMRLIAIDTLLFLPLFLVLLTAELIVLAVLASILFGGTFDLPAVAGPLALSLLCFVSLLLLAVPVGLATLLFRLIAFRVAAVSGQKTKGSIRGAWQLLKQKWVNFLLVGLVLIIIRLLVDSLLGWVQTPLPIWLGGLLALPLTAVLHAFYSAVWTTAYVKTMSNEQ